MANVSFVLLMKKGKILFIDSAHPALEQELVSDGFDCDFFQSHSFDKSLSCTICSIDPNTA